MERESPPALELLEKQAGQLVMRISRAYSYPMVAATAYAQSRSKLQLLVEAMEIGVKQIKGDTLAPSEHKQRFGLMDSAVKGGQEASLRQRANGVRLAAGFIHGVLGRCH